MAYWFPLIVGDTGFRIRRSRLAGCKGQSEDLVCVEEPDGTTASPFHGVQSALDYIIVQVRKQEE